MSDPISRQAAIDLVKDVCNAILNQCGSHCDGDDEVYDNLLEVDAVLKCNKEMWCDLWEHFTEAEDYCSLGECNNA